MARTPLLRLSAELEDALGVAIELARSGGALTATALSERLGRPFRFLQTVVAELRVAGLVGTRRGTGGGYWLLRPAADITVADVVRAIHHERTERDTSSDLWALWSDIDRSVYAHLGSVTLADLASARTSGAGA